MEEPFGDEANLKDEIIRKSQSNPSCPSKKEWLIIFIILGVTITSGIILIIYLINSSKDKIDNEKDNKEDKENKEDNKNNTIFSEIVCKYRIDDYSNNIQLLGEEFENINKSILNIVINNTKIEYTKNYKFSQNGTYQIKYILNKKINLDFMFKNIPTLQEVEINSKTDDDMILSMNSVFEGCFSLQNVSIHGFNTEQLKSTSKLFYSSGINRLNISNFKLDNVEDMTYMFSLSSINRLDLSGLNLNKVKNMSYMFSQCRNLNFLNLSNIKSNNLIDMSHICLIRLHK
jgi:hypothetical protein